MPISAYYFRGGGAPPRTELVAARDAEDEDLAGRSTLYADLWPDGSIRTVELADGTVPVSSCCWPG